MFYNISKHFYKNPKFININDNTNNFEYRKHEHVCVMLTCAVLVHGFVTNHKHVTALCRRMCCTENTSSWLFYPLRLGRAGTSSSSGLGCSEWWWWLGSLSSTHIFPLPQFFCGDGRSFHPEGQPSLQQSNNQVWLVEWPDRSHSSVKGRWQPTRNLPKGT